jgi:predicted membrane-bound spermidine synthase
MNRMQLWLLAGTACIVSASSMAVEIVAGRALAPYVGMSLYTWTMIIAVVLAGLSLGHWVGGVLADKSQRPSFWVAVTLLAASVTTLASTHILPIFEPIVTGTNPISHVGLLTVAAFLLPSLAAGILSPILTKMALDGTDQHHQGRILGLFFALGAGGAIIGTLAAGLFLISWLGTAISMMVIAGIYALLALPFWRGASRAIAGTASAGLLTVAAFSHQPVCTEESAYYCIRIDPFDLSGREAKVMALDHLAHGINDAADPLLLPTPYVHGVDELVRQRFKGKKLDAFFVGGGAFTLPRAWLARYPHGQMTVTEVDPVVTRLAQEQLWVPQSSRMTVLHQDARQALKNLPPETKFDVIFGDAFHDISIPQHLVTDEFNAEIAARLKPDGVYVTNVVDLLRAPQLMLSFAKTLQKRFKIVELWIDVQEVTPEEKRTTWIVLATNSPGKHAFEQKNAYIEDAYLNSTYGLSRRWIRIPTEGMIGIMPEDSLVTLTDDYSPVDRLLRPVLVNASVVE